MSRSLMTGITGLRSHQQKLDIHANNLANMNTIAFKSQSTVFSDLMYNTARGGSAASEESGGINPQTTGTGVQTAQVSRDFGQGTFETTSQMFDYAIQGPGFFTLLSPTGDSVFTRAGAFGLDSQGRLVDPSTGYLVQRIGNLGEATDGGVQFQELGDTFINVPLGSAIPGEASSAITFDGNLRSSASPPVREVLATFRGFQSGGSAATGASLVGSLDVNTIPYVPGDVINIDGTNPDGSPFSTTVPADTGTLQDVIDAMNAVMTGGTAAIGADGTLTVTADNPGDSLLTVVISDDAANTGESDWTSNGFFASTPGSDGESFDLSMDIFDERGENHRVTFTFVKETVNSWNVEASISPDSGVMIDGSVLNLTFAENGSYAQAGLNGVGDTNIEIQLNGISTPQTIDLNFESLTHLASDFLITQRQDGIPPGNLTSVAVSTSGELTGLSSNGRALPLAQLAIASFSNPAALDAIGSNYFLRSISSGDPVIGVAARGNRGEVMGGQLERSNVDIAQEFTQLIVAQRGFSANARTITVSDEMLEELTNIIR